MNSVNDIYRRRQGGSPSACPPDPCVCSTCGMLECLCRPRFFAGQILTADDLNRLDGYIRGKQRLHNRQLHGWGVVNGLEVTCNPCGDGVAVGCGYALSPCGEDIVVCEAVSVDVCALIKRCCADERWDPCDPPRRPRPQECDAGEQDWILAIRYAETPTRGVQPLRTPDCACAGAGSSGGGGCGCGGSCAGSRCDCAGAAPVKKPRTAPVQCEPTVICEGYAFEVYRKPPDPLPDSDNGRDVLNPQSELFQRFQCCIELLVKGVPTMPGPLAPPATAAAAQAWYQWIVAMRSQLRRYFASHGAYNCALLAQFDTIPFPTSGTLANAGAIFLAAVLLVVVWMDALFACFCSALLPPCPPPAPGSRVPLAAIHVSGHPCRVLRICNWSVHRKFATTFPALQYWLGLLPFGVTLRRQLEKICCFDIGAIIRNPDQPTTTGQPVPGPPAPGIMAGRTTAASTDGQGKGNAEEAQAQAAWERANGRLNPELDEPARIDAARSLLAGALARAGQTLDLGDVAAGLMGAKGRDNAPLAPAELANLPQFMAANQLLRPIAGQVMSPGLSMLAGLAGLTGLTEGGASESPPAPELDALRAELAALQDSVRAQAAEIDQLKQRGSPASRKRQPRHE